MRCITGQRFNMKATVLTGIAQNQPAPEMVTPEAIEAELPGRWENIQDPDTGGIRREWVVDQAPVQTAAAGAVVVMPSSANVQSFDIECYARGFTELGFRSSANTESFEDGVYKAGEVIQMVFPAKYALSRGFFVTSIRSRTDELLWVEEEISQATVFEVQGVTPTFDPFGRHIDNIAILKRSDIQ